MINKSKLWFLTLSSIILVLAIYYIAFPFKTPALVFSEANSKDSDIKIQEDVLTAMRVTKDEDDSNEIKTLQEVLLDNSKSLEEKNNAYEQIKYLNANKSLEEKLEKDVMNNYKIDSFISIKENNIKVVIANKEKSKETAADLISYINEVTDSNYYVSVKFE